MKGAPPNHPKLSKTNQTIKSRQKLLTRTQNVTSKISCWIVLGIERARSERAQSFETIVFETTQGCSQAEAPTAEFLEGFFAYFLIIYPNPNLTQLVI